MMMYVLSFKKHSQEQRQKGICFFSHFFFFSRKGGGEEGGRGNIVANRRKALGATWGGDEPNERLTYQVDGKIGAYQANNG